VIRKKGQAPLLALLIWFSKGPPKTVKVDDSELSMVMKVTRPEFEKWPAVIERQSNFSATLEIPPLSTQSRQARNRLTSIVSRTSECPLSCSPWEISLTPRPPRSLPVALRPYPDEGLGSWLSRTGAIYGCTTGELLSQFVKSERKPFDQIDLQPPGSVEPYRRHAVDDSV
jgi:hypothetical protein